MLLLVHEAHLQNTLRDTVRILLEAKAARIAVDHSGIAFHSAQHPPGRMNSRFPVQFKAGD